MTQQTPKTGQSLFIQAYEAVSTPSQTRTVTVCLLAFAALAALVITKIPQRLWIHLFPTSSTDQIILQQVSQSYSATSCTYEGSPEGIIDFSHVLPEIGIAYVADVTGHGKPAVQKKIRPILEQFNEELKAGLINQKLSIADLGVLLRNKIFELNHSIGNVGTASTFSLAALATSNGKKHLILLHVGDSVLFHLKRTGEFNRLTPEEKSGFNQHELSSLKSPTDIYIMTKEVQSGDKIYGMTDGITDALSMHEIKAYLFVKNNLLNDENLETLKTLLLPKITDRNKGDDIGLFEMTVP